MITGIGTGITKELEEYRSLKGKEAIRINDSRKSNET